MSLAASGNNFGCLKEVNSTLVLFSLLSLNETVEMSVFMWIDSPGGLLPDISSVLIAKGQFVHIPFIAGTNLDEGLFIIK